ncbi:MAG: branched-chain amino acid ABC transporter permease [Actinomycetota bacterium]
MGLVLQVLVVGSSAGAVYGLVAIGFVLVYRLTAVLQFAHGDVVGVAAFATVLFAGTRLGGSSVPGGRYALSAAGSISVGAVAAVLVYLLAVRPFMRRASAIGWIGATVAVAFAIEAVLAATFPNEAYVVPQPAALDAARPLSLPGGATLPVRALWVLGIGAVVALATGWLLKRTTFGSALDAIATEPAGARAVGLPVDRLLAYAFALSGALAAIAALSIAPEGGTISTQTGALLGLKAIVAAMLGSMVAGRAFMAAIGVGVLEAAVTSIHLPGASRALVGAAWHDLAPLLLLVLVLAFRPASRAREQTE